MPGTIAEVIVPEWFGARGDGTGDDGPALAEALNQGRPVVLPGRAYNLPNWTQYTLRNKTAILGLHTPRLIFGSAVKFLKAAQAVTLTGLTFVGSGSIVETATTDGYSEVDEIVIRDCTCDGVTNAIALETPFSSFDCSHTRFINCIGDAIRCGVNDYSLQNTWLRMRVANCECRGLTGFGSNATRFAILYGRQATISGNVVDGITGVSGNETHAIYTKVRHGTISGNTVRGVATGTVTSGITLKGKPRGVTDDPQGFSCTVTGNTVDCGGVTEYGIRVDSGDAVVSGNGVDDATLTAIDVASDITSRTLIANNRLYGQDAANTTGIAATTDGANIQIVSNQSHGYRKGIKVGATTTSLTDVLVSSNQITNATTHGIEISPTVALTGLTITGNLIRTSGNQGIRFNASGVVTDVSMFANDIESASYGIVVDGGVSPVRVASKSNKIRTTGAIARELSWTTGKTPTGFDIEQTYETQTTSATAVYVWNVELADNTAALITASVVGVKSDGSDRAGYLLTAIAHRDGAGVVVTDIAVSNSESNAAWNAVIMAHPSSTNNVALQLTGVAATTINWCAHIKVIAA